MATNDDEKPLNMGDVESRLMLQTRTTDGSWDQITGISQELINKTFEELFQRHPTMAQMHENSDTGRIDAELEPPRIIIPAGNYGTSSQKVLYLIRFKSGTIIEKKKYLIEDLTGWVIAYEVELSQFSNGTKLPSESEQKRQEKQIKSFRDSLKIRRKSKNKDGVEVDELVELPGDYSIERLYCKLSSAKFEKPDGDHSVAVIDGEKVTWSDWMVDNKTEYLRLKYFIESWAIDQDAAGRNALGYQIQLPVKAGSSPTGLSSDPPIEEPTFVPTDLVYQTYTYRNAKDCLNGATGDSGYGTRNALLYCEMTKARSASEGGPEPPLRLRPTNIGLLWSGNFTTMSRKPDGPDAIEGTYILSRDVLFEHFILPKLRALNQASEICHQAPVLEQLPDSTQIVCKTPYNVCFDPDTSLSSSKYDFENLNPKFLPDRENGYKFEKTNSHPRKEEAQKYLYKENNNYRDSNARAKVNDNSIVKVSWEAGSSTLHIEGALQTEKVIEWDHGGFMTIEKWDEDTRRWAWVKDKYTGKWSLDITFQTHEGYNKNTVLDVDFNISDIDITCTPNNYNMESTNYAADLERDIKERFGKVLPLVTQSIRDKLRGSGRFSFPGQGVYSFHDPCFTKWGDLIARVEYYPLEPGSLILVPQPAHHGDVPSPDTRTREPVIAPETGRFQLTWTALPDDRCKVSHGKPDKLTFRATNTKKGAIALREIRVRFSANTADNNLLYTNKVYLQTKDTIEDHEPETKRLDDSESPEIGYVVIGTPVESGQATEPTTGEASSSSNDNEERSESGEKEQKVLDHCVVTVRQQLQESNVNTQINCLSKSVRPKQRLIWELTISGPPDGILRIESNEWIEITIEGPWAMPGQKDKSGQIIKHRVTIEEEFDQPKDTHWVEDFFVAIDI